MGRTIICFIVKKKYESSMLKKMKNLSIEDNSGCASLVDDLLKRESIIINKTKVILKHNDQESNDYLLYHYISKF
jgi:hypothetical protein